MPLTQSEIDAMSSEERLDLMARLESGGYLAGELRGLATQGKRRRRLSLLVTTIASVVLIPWTIMLAIQLPDRHVARDWSVTWVGFDVLLCAALATTAFLAWQRRLLVTLTAFAAGMLLLTDAWFDITTAGHHELGWSILTAAIAEVPLALFLLWVSFRLTLEVAGLVVKLTDGQGLGAVWRQRLESQLITAPRRRVR